MIRQRAQNLLSRASALATAKNGGRRNASNHFQHRLTRSSERLSSARAVSTLSSPESESSPLWNMTNAAALVAAAVATTAFATADSPAVTTDCCGIVGVIGTDKHKDAREFLLDGLTILKNRGYDSAGIATVPSYGGEFSISKYASDGDKADSIELVAKNSKHLGHSLGIAHTRWYVTASRLALLVHLLKILTNSLICNLNASGQHMEGKQTKMPTLIQIPLGKLHWRTTVFLIMQMT